MAKSGNKRPKKLTVDFTGVDRGGGKRSAHVDEGDYLAKVIDGQIAKKKDANSKYVLWTLSLQKPKKALNKKIYYRTTLKDEALYQLRGFLIDLLGEENVPQRKVDVPLARIIKRQPLVGVTLEDDEYPEGSGKFSSSVAATFPAADWDALHGKSKASDDDDDEDEDEDEEDEDEEEEDEDEEEEEEEDEEDEEEEEEKPKKKAKKGKEKKAKKKKSKKPVVDDDEDEDDDADEIDVDDL